MNCRSKVLAVSVVVVCSIVAVKIRHSTSSMEDDHDATSIEQSSTEIGLNNFDASAQSLPTTSWKVNASSRKLTDEANELRTALLSKDQATIDRKFQEFLRAKKVSKEEKTSALWEVYGEVKDDQSAARYVLDTLSTTSDPNSIPRLINELNSRNTSDQLKPSLVASLSSAFTFPPASGEPLPSEALNKNSAIVDTLRQVAQSSKKETAQTAIIELSRVGAPNEAIAALDRGQQLGLISEEDYFRESIIQLASLPTTSQLAVANRITTLAANNTGEKSAETLLQLATSYFQGALSVQSLAPETKETLLRFMEQHQPTLGSNSREVLSGDAVTFMNWMSLSATLSGVADDGVPRYVTKKIASPSSSAQQVVAALMSQFGDSILSLSTAEELQVMQQLISTKRDQLPINSDGYIYYSRYLNVLDNARAHGAERAP